MVLVMDTTPNRKLIFELAMRAECAPSTAKKALLEGANAVKGTALRERLRAAMAGLGVPGGVR